MASMLIPLLIGCVIGFSLILLIVSLVSYKRLKSPRLLLVGLAFLVFLVKGVLLAIGLVFIPGITESVELLVLDLIVLLFLYFAIAKR